MAFDIPQVKKPATRNPWQGDLTMVTMAYGPPSTSSDPRNWRDLDWIATGPDRYPGDTKIDMPITYVICYNVYHLYIYIRYIYIYDTYIHICIVYNIYIIYVRIKCSCGFLSRIAEELGSRTCRKRTDRDLQGDAAPRRRRWEHKVTISMAISMVFNGD